MTGYVLGPGSPPEQKEIRPVLDVLDDAPLFPAVMIPLFRWAAEYYKHPLGAVIQTALPGGLTVAESAVWRISEAGRARLAQDRLPADEAVVLERLAGKPLRTRPGTEIPRKLLEALERRGDILRTRTLRAGGARALQERWVRPGTGGSAGGTLPPKKQALCEAVAAVGEMSVRDLLVRAPHARNHLRALERSGHLEIFGRRLYRDPFGEPILPDAPPALGGEIEVAHHGQADLGQLGTLRLLRSPTVAPDRIERDGHAGATQGDFLTQHEDLVQHREGWKQKRDASLRFHHADSLLRDRTRGHTEKPDHTARRFILATSRRRDRRQIEAA